MNKHVSKCNSDIDIPTKIKDVDMIQNKNVNIHHNKNMNIPSNNNNQASVPVKVHLNKESNQIFNSDTVNDHVSTTNNDIDIPTKI